MTGADDISRRSVSGATERLNVVALGQNGEGVRLDRSRCGRHRAAPRDHGAHDDGEDGGGGEDQAAVTFAYSATKSRAGGSRPRPEGSEPLVDVLPHVVF